MTLFPGDSMMEESEGLQQELVSPVKLQVRKSKLCKGYGVFATEDIEEGEIVEEACFVRTSYRLNDLIHHQLRQICYPFPCSCNECKVRGCRLVLSSGLLQVYNHSNTSNVGWNWSLRRRIIQVVAKRDISKGEEVFHAYGPNYSENMMKEVEI